jgi:hypothetical protein
MISVRNVTLRRGAKVVLDRAFRQVGSTLRRLR